MPFEDITLICSDCGSKFTFTANDQEFFQKKGFERPRRCRKCREARRSGEDASSESDTYGPAASFGGRTPRQLHPAVCAGCGEATEVPFQPRHDRPVYCSSCYEEMRGKGRD